MIALGRPAGPRYFFYSLPKTHSLRECNYYCYYYYYWQYYYCYYYHCYFYYWEYYQYYNVLLLLQVHMQLYFHSGHSTSSHFCVLLIVLLRGFMNSMSPWRKWGGIDPQITT